MERYATMDLTSASYSKQTDSIHGVVTLDETCICGGTFHVRTTYDMSLPQLREWRARHKHLAYELAQMLAEGPDEGPAEAVAA